MALATTNVVTNYRGTVRRVAVVFCLGCEEEVHRAARVTYAQQCALNLAHRCATLEGRVLARVGS